MNQRGARVAVWIVAVAIAAGAGYAVYTLRQQVEHEREHASEIGRRVHDAGLLVEQLRAAQQAYVAQGQGSDFWMARVTDTTGALASALGALEHDVSSDAARSAARGAAGVLGDFQRLDRRARGFVQSSQPLMASDVIFTESVGATAVLLESMVRVNTEEQNASVARIRALDLDTAYILIGAALVVLGVALLLVPVPRRETPQDTREALRALMAADTSPAGAATLKTEPARTTVTLPVRDSAPADPAPPAVTPPRSVPAEADAADLGLAAELCTDLARVLDPSELPALLARTARLLDASGVIVWVADRAGAALFPAVAHGYSPALLARMHAIPRDADNAAAAAWREGAERTVAAQGQSPGALVTPILTADGCVGVLAAETLHGAERRETTRAVAAIIAAQLATLVTTLPAEQTTRSSECEVRSAEPINPTRQFNTSAIPDSCVPHFELPNPNWPRLGVSAFSALALRRASLSPSPLCGRGYTPA